MAEPKFTAGDIRPSLEWHMIALEEAREQGRREVYAEIAKISPWLSRQFSDGNCFFCSNDMPQHRPDCLWLRARAAVESAQANHEQP